MGSLQLSNIEQLSNIKGKVKAVTLLTDQAYISEVHGDEKISLVEDELQQMGFPFHYSAINSPFSFVPLKLRIASLYAIRNVLQLTDDQIQEMGRLATRNSAFTKLGLRFLIDLKKMAKGIPRHWQRHYTTGSMDVGELHEDEKYLVVRLKDFPVPKLYCCYLAGYILGDVELIGNGQNLRISETKCMSYNDDYHEFKVMWD